MAAGRELQHESSNFVKLCKVYLRLTLHDPAALKRFSDYYCMSVDDRATGGGALSSHNPDGCWKRLKLTRTRRKAWGVREERAGAMLDGCDCLEWEIIVCQLDIMLYVVTNVMKYHLEREGS